MQVDAGELLRHEVEQAALVEPVDLGVELETVKDVPDRGRKRLDVAIEVLADVILISHERLHVHGRGIVEASIFRCRKWKK